MTRRNHTTKRLNLLVNNRFFHAVILALGKALLNQTKFFNTNLITPRQRQCVVC